MEALPKNCKACCHKISVKPKDADEESYCWHPATRQELGRRIMCDQLRLDDCPLKGDVLNGQRR